MRWICRALCLPCTRALRPHAVDLQGTVLAVHRAWRAHAVDRQGTALAVYRALRPHAVDRQGAVLAMHRLASRRADASSHASLPLTVGARRG